MSQPGSISMPLPIGCLTYAFMFYLHCLNFIFVIIIRWNWNQVFYLLSISEVAYIDCVGIYKAFKFATSPKIECLNLHFDQCNRLNHLTSGVT